MNLDIRHLLGKGILEVEPLGQVLLGGGGLSIHCWERFVNGLKLARLYANLGQLFSPLDRP